MIGLIITAACVGVVFVVGWKCGEFNTARVLADQIGKLRGELERTRARIAREIARRGEIHDGVKNAYTKQEAQGKVN